jgi:hypothetical protein
LLQKLAKFAELIALLFVMVTPSAFCSHVWELTRVSWLGKNDACDEKFEPPLIDLQTLMMQIFVARLAPRSPQLHGSNVQWKFSEMKFLII